MKVLPNFLKPGDTVAIVSPSGLVERMPVVYAKKLLESWGLVVKLGEHVFSRQRIFAGSDQQRANDFNVMIHDDEVKAIFCSRGGYGAIRIVEAIDFDYLEKHPKWIIGFSDVTIFHSALNMHGLCSIHGVMPNSFGKTHQHSLQSLQSVLFGYHYSYSIPYNRHNRFGMVTGELVGGNLSSLLSLRGTKYDFDYSGKILFIEDVGEKLYHLDRMMRNLYVSGVLANLKGLLVGGFTEMTEGSKPFGVDASQIIASVVVKYDYPVLFDFPAGHITENMSFILGKEITLISEKKNPQVVA